MSAIQMVILAIVALVLGLFVVRPVLSRPPSEQGAPIALPPAEPGAERAETTALVGEVADASGGFPEMQFASDTEELPNLPSLSFNASEDAPAIAADPVDRLRAMIGDRQEETVEILRSWLEDTEERA